MYTDPEQLRRDILARTGIDIGDPVSEPIDKNIRDIKNLYHSTITPPRDEQDKEILRLTRLQRAQAATQRDFALDPMDDAPDGDRPATGKPGASSTGRWYSDMEDRLTNEQGPDAEVDEQGFWEATGKALAGGFVGTITSAGVGAGAAIKKATGNEWLYKNSLVASSFMDDALEVQNPNLYHKVVSGAGSWGSIFIPGFGAAWLATKFGMATKLAAALKSGGAAGRFLQTIGKVVGGSRGVVGGATMGLAESVAESGETIQNALAMGMTEEQAFEAGQKVVLPNALIGAVTNFTPFSPALRAKGVLGVIGSRPFRVVGGAAMEGTQEELQAQAQEVALGIGEWTPSIRHMDEFIVGAIVGGGVGTVTAAMRPPLKLTEVNFDPETQPPAQGESDLDTAVNMAAQARQMTNDEINLRLTRTEQLAKSGDIPAMRQSLEPNDFIAYKALRNERERRSLMASLEQQRSPEIMQADLELAEKIGYDKLTAGERGYIGLAIDSLSRQGMVDPVLGSKIAHQISVETGRGFALNANASANHQGDPFVGSINMSKNREGKWVVNAQDANFNHTYQVFDNEADAKAFGAQAEQQIKEGIPQAQSPAPTFGQEVTEVMGRQAQMDREIAEKAQAPAGPRTIDIERGGAALVLGEDGRMKRVNVGKYEVDTVPDEEGEAVLSKEGKATLDIIRKAKVRVKFFKATDKTDKGLLGVYHSRNHTLYVRADGQAGQFNMDGGTVADMTIAHEFGHWMSRTNYDAAVKVFNWVKENKPDVLAQNRQRVEAAAYPKNQYHDEDVAEGIAAYLIQQGGFKELINEQPGLIRGWLRQYANSIGADELNAESPTFAGSIKSKILVSLLGDGLRFEGNQRDPLVQGEIDARRAAQSKVEATKRSYKTVADFLHNVVYGNAVDDLHPLKRLLSKVDPKNESYNFIRTMVRGGTGIANVWTVHGPRHSSIVTKDGFAPIVAKGGRTAKSLVRIAEDNKLTGKKYEDIGVYLDAKRRLSVFRFAPEKVSEVEQQRIDDLREIHDSLERDNPEFAKAAQEYNDYANAMLQYSAEEDLISNEDYQNITRAYDFYSPLNTLRETGGRAGGKPQAKVGKQVKSLYEVRDVVTVHPVEALFRNTYSLIKAVQDNTAIRKVALAAAQNPALAQESYMKPEAILRSVEQILIDLKGNGVLSKEEVKTILDKYQQDQSLPAHIRMYTAGRHLAKNQIAFFDEGKLRVFDVDPIIAEAFARDKGAWRDSKFWPMQAAAKMTSMLRAGAIMTPEFQSRNWFRDVFTAFVMSPRISLTPKGVSTFAKEWATAWKSVINQDIKYQNFAMSGAQMADFLALDRPTIEKRIMLVMRKGTFKKGDYWNYAARHPIDAMWQLLGFASKTSEEVTRLAVWKSSMSVLAKKSPTLSWEQMAEIAAMDARDSSVDFNRIGKYVRALNMMVPFFNAGVQGQDKIWRALFSKNAENKKGAWTKAFVAVTLPSLLIHAVNKDDEWYQKRPAWEKNTFWLFHVGNTVIRIPKPFDLGIIFGSLPERIWDAQGGDPFAMREWAEQYLSTTVLSPRDFLSQLVPGVSTIQSIYSNYDSYRNTPIVKGTLNESPAFQQYIQSTNKFSKWLFPFLYDKTDGLVNKSPIKFDFLINGMFAGLGDYALAMAGAFVPDDPNAPTGDPWYYSAPVLRSALSSDQPNYDNYMDRFFDLYEEAEINYNGYLRAKNRMKPEEMALVARIEGGPIQAYEFLDRTAQVVNSISRTIQTLQDVPVSMVSREEKRERIDFLKKKRTELLRDVMAAHLENQKKFDEAGKELYLKLSGGMSQ